MKKQKKGLLCCKTILSMGFVMVVCSACMKTAAEPETGVSSWVECEETCIFETTEATTEAMTKAVPPVFDEKLLDGIWMTLNDKSDLSEMVNAVDADGRSLPVTLDESDIDRSKEGEYLLYASAVDSGGRESTMEVPVMVLDMSYIDTEEKVLFFTALIEEGDAEEMEELKTSLWSPELGEKYAIPKVYIRGSQPEDKSVEKVTVPSLEPELSPPEANGYRDELACQMFAKVNAYRRENGLLELAWEETLAGYTDIRTVELTTNFAHEGPNGLKPSERWGVGENIAAYGVEFSAVDAPFTAWKGSEGHNFNMLNAEYTKSAVGCYRFNGNYFWVQLFAY